VPWLTQIGQDPAGCTATNRLRISLDAACALRTQSAPSGSTVTWATRSSCTGQLGHPSRGSSRTMCWRSGAGAPSCSSDLVENRLACWLAVTGKPAWLDRLLIELPHFLMERKMLLGFRDRAEGERQRARPRRRTAIASRDAVGLEPIGATRGKQKPPRRSRNKTEPDEAKERA
jgi:hypothetical protein